MTDAAWTTHELAIDGPEAGRPSRLDLEWLVTNGTGAFAMGTAPGVNTRRYHGLFIASRHPPVSRVVALNQMIERLELSGGKGKAKAAEFTTSLFHGDNDKELFTPEGHEHLVRFTRGLDVGWEYQWQSIRFTRRLSLHWKQQTATLTYTLSGLEKKAMLRLSPMLTLRDFHSLLKRDDAGAFDMRPDGRTLRVTRGEVTVTFHCSHGQFAPSGDWWYKLYYPLEAERGLDHREDAYVPGGFEIELKPGDHKITFTIALGEEPVEADGAGRAEHLAPMVDYIAADESTGVISESVRRQLVIAADDFVVDRMIKGTKLATIMAGYPWFADWGRDTFIALPGLLLTTGRYDEARATLDTFAKAIHNGLVPNRFDDYNEEAAHYNTVDASLWFIHAAMQYYDATRDESAWDQWLRDACLRIIEAYIRGTDCDIRVAGDGLVQAGGPGTQLTWMDAACNGVVFTPRHGKAVEINALWYNALVGMGKRIKKTHKRESDHFNRLAGRIRRAFMKVFWNTDGCRLNDHAWMDDSGEESVERGDETIRPNQIFVAALPESPMPMTKCRQIIKCVKQHLLTPYGLRTLPEDDPGYHPNYTGGPYERDEAYHQGTIWPWLIGPYAEAILRTGKFEDKAKREALEAITPLLERLAGDGLGQLNEIHEAKRPHRPAGCPAQAWSIAEVLRVVRLIEKGGD